MLLLTLTGKALIGNLRYVMALFFSMLGDLMGALNSLELQLTSFALAHVCFIAYFYGMIRKAGISYAKPDFAKVAILLLLYTIICVVILPNVDDSFMFCAIMVYACLILSMLFMAWKIVRILSFVGALFFVISDSILGYYIFVGPVPLSGYLIMVSYYLAQLLLFSDAVSIDGIAKQA